MLYFCGYAFTFLILGFVLWSVENDEELEVYFPQETRDQREHMKNHPDFIIIAAVVISSLFWPIVWCFVLFCIIGDMVSGE